MKKILFIAAALVLGSFSMSAQDSAKDRLSEIEEMIVKEKAHKSSDLKKVFSVEPFVHMTLGNHFTDGDIYAGGFMDSGEFNLNLVKLSFNPTQFLGFSAGIDFKHDWFRSDNSRFYIGDSGEASLSSAYTDVFDTYYSSMRLFSVSAPLLMKISIGDFGIGGGAELSYGLGGNARTYFTSGKNETSYRTRGAKPNTFSYSIIGAVSYSDFTIYGKYYPENNAYLPGLSYWTLGIGISFL